MVQEDEQKLPLVARLKIEAPTSMGVTISPSFAVAETDPSDGAWLENPPPECERYLAEIRVGQTLRIGRSRNNDLVLEDGNVSRYHAVMIASEAGIVLSDLASLNGTFANHRRITTPLDLNNGDRISLGENNAVFIVEFQSASTDREVVTTAFQTQNAGMKVVNVTVLLADIRGYTKMSQTLPSTEVAAALQAWFRQINQIVQQYGGQVDKYIGDCVMALWVGQASHPQQAACSAAQAAQEILRLTHNFSQHEWSYHASYPWICRVALNTGSALSGSLGTREAREFAVLGDSINVAFRLEGIASKLNTESILGATTAALIASTIPVRSLGEVELEGRAGTVEVFTFNQTAP